MGSQDSKFSQSDFNDLVENGKFSSDEINEWFKKFKSDFPSGNIRKFQFMVIYTKMFPNGDAVQFTDHIFRTYDLNDDGIINFREFIVTLSIASRGTTEEKLKWAFRLYDINQNGQVSIEELEAILTALYKARNQKDAIDCAKKTAESIMRDLDTDRNGSISETEFIQGAMSNPKIKSLLQGN